MRRTLLQGMGIWASDIGERRQPREHMSHRTRLCALLVGLGAAATLAGCNIALQRQHTDAGVSTGAAGDSSTEAECASLRSQIRTNQIKLRQAPTTSVNEDIVAAAQGNASRRLDQLRAQYDDLGCSDTQLPSQRGRFAPLPPAPGGKSN
jgi:hypothetical protein